MIKIFSLQIYFYKPMSIIFKQFAKQILNNNFLNFKLILNN